MKMMIALVVLTLAGCQLPAEGTVVAGTGGFKVERLFTVDGCTAYRFNDARTVHFVRCGTVTTTSWQEPCGKNCWREVQVVANQGPQP